MTILDTFYLLFKTDIPTGTAKDVAALDRQLDELGKKGKKRSEDENKQYEALKKQRKDLLDETKQQQREVDKLADSFRGLAQNALGAVTAFATFGGLKAGILDAAKFNADIATQADVTRQSADELRAYGAAVAHFGGDADSFIKKQFAVAQAAGQAGVTYKNVAAYYNSIHDLVAQAGSPGEQQRIFGLYGISDIHEQMFLLSKDYYEQIGLQQRLAIATHEDYEEALKFRQASQDAGTAFTTAFTRIGTDVLPTVSKEMLALNNHLKTLEGQEQGIESFFIEAASAAGLLIPPLRAISAAILSITVASRYAKDASEFLFGKYKPTASPFGSNRGSATQFLPTQEAKSNPQTSTGNPAVDFWLSQGYSLDKAIALAANEQAESSGNPGARNYGGGSQHYGLYQFDENRRREIAAGTGIDVANANADQQRLAAAWDMKRRGNDIGLNATTGVAEGTDYVNRRFEVSGEDSGRRIAIANQISSGIPSIPPSAGGSSRALSVKIDNVSIHTQATDAPGISRALSQQLQSDLGNLYYDWNDGVDY